MVSKNVKNPRAEKAESRRRGSQEEAGRSWRQSRTQVNWFEVAARHGICSVTLVRTFGAVVLLEQVSCRPSNSISNLLSGWFLQPVIRKALDFMLEMIMAKRLLITAFLAG